MILQGFLDFKNYLHKMGFGLLFFCLIIFSFYITTIHKKNIRIIYSKPEEDGGAE